MGVTQHRQSCSSVPSPAPLPSSRLPGCLACSAQGTHSGLAAALARQQGLEKVGPWQGKPQCIREWCQPHGNWVPVSDYNP